ncbi:MAG: heparinase II/III-family protein [Armatimonadota bacterium]|nr:heparinase II/III-family protein [Armatimonadota bacterium]
MKISSLHPGTVLLAVVVSTFAMCPSRACHPAEAPTTGTTRVASTAAMPTTGQKTPTTISDAETTTGWDGVMLIDDAKADAHAVRLVVPAGKASGTGFNLGRANVDFSKGGTIRFWYRLSGAGETNLMLKVVTPTFADNFQAVWEVFPAQKADGQWHQGVINLASPYQKWGAKPETGGNYLYFRTHAGAGSSLTLDLDQVEFVLAESTTATTPPAPAAPPRAAKGPTLDPPDAARVKEIASYLDATPQGLGFTLDNRAPWEAFGATQKFRDVMLPLAERFLNEPIPEVSEAAYAQAIQTGSRDINAPIDRRRFRLVHFVLAEGVENKGRFIPAIEKELAAICSEGNWIIAAHVKFTGKNDLGSAMTAWTVATAVSMLGDRLSAATQKTVKDAVNQRVVQPFLEQMRDKTAPIDFWRNSPFNWNAVVHGGITGAALALTDSVQERAEIIAAAEKETQFYIKGFPADGYSTEGMGYWKYGFGHYIMLAEAVLEATHGKVNLYDQKNIRSVAQFPRRFEVAPEVYPAYSDSSFKDEPSRWLYYILDRRYNLGDEAPRSLVLDPTFSTFLYAYSINMAFDPTKIVSTAKNAAITQGHRIRDWFETSQTYVGRPPAGQAGLAMSFKGGNNGTSHGHNDLGSFVVVQGKTPLLVDPGSTVYNAATFGANRYDNQVINSYGHSVPRVAGQLQGQGEKHFATITNTKFSDAADSVTLDLTKGYNVPTLRSLLRTFDYARAGQSAVTVTDRVEFTSPQAFGTALVTFGEAKEEKPGVWIISQGDQSVRAIIDAGGAPFTVTNEILKDQAAAGKVRRLGIDLNAPAAQAIVTIKITPAT